MTQITLSLICMVATTGLGQVVDQISIALVIMEHHLVLETMPMLLETVYLVENGPLHLTIVIVEMV